MGKRVLVTGGGGFIGAHLVADQLSRGKEVVALDLDLERAGSLADRAELIPGDIGDREMVVEALQGVDTVFHLAATHLSLTVPYQEYHRVNVEATRDLALLSAAAGVRRFVHCSTVGVFGELKALPADEGSPCHPEFAYEKTKLSGEMAVLQVGRDEGLSVVVIRPAWVYGPGCPRTRRLFGAIAKGRFVVAGRGETRRHCIYIRDMLEAFELAADRREADGQVLIVADDRAVTVRSLVDEIAAIAGARRPPSVPRPLLSAVALAAEIAFTALGKEAPLSRRSLRFFSGNTAFLTERVRTVLGFQPTYTLSAGLRETWKALENGQFMSVPMRGASPPIPS